MTLQTGRAWTRSSDAGAITRDVSERADDIRVHYRAEDGASVGNNRQAEVGSA